MFPEDRKPMPVAVEYDSRGARVTKQFPDEYAARRFYVAKAKVGANPKVKRSDMMPEVPTTTAAVVPAKKAPVKKAPAKKATKKAAAAKAPAPKTGKMTKPAKKAPEPSAKAQSRLAVLGAIAKLGGKEVPMPKVVALCAKAGMTESQIGHQLYESYHGDEPHTVRTKDEEKVEYFTLTAAGKAFLG